MSNADPYLIVIESTDIVCPVSSEAASGECPCSVSTSPIRNSLTFVKEAAI